MATAEGDLLNAFKTECKTNDSMSSLVDGKPPTIFIGRSRTSLIKCLLHVGIS
jgi:hypothetical protein